jgi:hypothetical protein
MADVLHGTAGDYVVWGCLHRHQAALRVWDFRLRHPDMRLVPVPARRMRLVLSHASCCALGLSELERRGGS